MKVCHILFVTCKNFKLYCEKCLKPYKLTNGLYFYLIYINKNRNCSLNDVSTEFEVDKAHTTRTISRLEQDGYIEKSKTLMIVELFS